jgi:L,D-transpeptidase catalytic domain
MRWIGVTALSAALLLPASAKADVLVNISKSQQRMAVSVDGAELYRWPVSTGRHHFPTPSGSFHPLRLERHWYSRQYEMTPMPWSMFFFRGYAVHGTMEARNLGHAVSHGCVRLRPDHAATLFSLMHKQRLAATRIVVTDGPLPAPPRATPMAGAAPSRPVQVSTTDAKAVQEEPAAEPAAPLGDIAATASRRASAYEQLARETLRGGESEVLRGRQAWLRQLARKYGLNHW